MTKILKTKQRGSKKRTELYIGFSCIFRLLLQLYSPLCFADILSGGLSFTLICVTVKPAGLWSLCICPWLHSDSELINLLEAASLSNWDGHKAASPFSPSPRPTAPSWPGSYLVADGTDMMCLSAFFKLLHPRENILMRLLQISHTIGTVINQMRLFVSSQQWVIYSDGHYESCTCSRSLRPHISFLPDGFISSVFFLYSPFHALIDYICLFFLHLHLFNNNPLCNGESFHYCSLLFPCQWFIRYLPVNHIVFSFLPLLCAALLVGVSICSGRVMSVWWDCHCLLGVGVTH